MWLQEVKSINRTSEEPRYCIIEMNKRGKRRKKRRGAWLSVGEREGWRNGGKRGVKARTSDNGLEMSGHHVALDGR